MSKCVRHDSIRNKCELNVFAQQTTNKRIRLVPCAFITPKRGFAYAKKGPTTCFVVVCQKAQTIFVESVMGAIGTRFGDGMDRYRIRADRHVVNSNSYT